MPPTDHRTAWQQDYNEMAEAMFYDDRPTFDEILRAVGDFERALIRQRQHPEAHRKHIAANAMQVSVLKNIL